MFKDAKKGSFCDFGVLRHDCGEFFAVDFSHDDVASFLVENFEASLLEDFNNFLSGKEGEFHAVINIFPV